LGVLGEVQIIIVDRRIAEGGKVDGDPFDLIHPWAEMAFGHDGACSASALDGSGDHLTRLRDIPHGIRLLEERGELMEVDIEIIEEPRRSSPGREDGAIDLWIAEVSQEGLGQAIDAVDQVIQMLEVQGRLDDVRIKLAESIIGF
jgi:hypothetical protein